MSAEGPFPVNTILAEAIDDQDYYPLSSALDPTITPTTERASFRLALGAGRHGGRFTAGNVGRHEGAVLLLSSSSSPSSPSSSSPSSSGVVSQLSIGQSYRPSILATTKMKVDVT
jgi:hypothetical protein